MIRTRLSDWRRTHPRIMRFSRISVVLVTALATTSLLSRSVFVYGTPFLNPNFATEMSQALTQASNAVSNPAGAASGAIAAVQQAAAAVTGLLSGEVANESGTQPLSSSKHGIFLHLSYSEGARKIIASCPRVIKIIDPDNAGMMEAIRDYKARCQGGTVVLRVYLGPDLYYNGPDDGNVADPTASAVDMVENHVKPAIMAMSESDRALVDYIETPNEADTTTDWKDMNMPWLGEFWLEVAKRYQSEFGIPACIGSFAVTNPNNPNSLSNFEAVANFLRQNGGAICYHGYTESAMNEPPILDDAREKDYSLHYRKIHEKLPGIPIIISEGGLETKGGGGGWKVHGGLPALQDWLNWYDNHIRTDDYVLGTTLYEIGTNSTYDLEAAADAIVALLNNAGTQPTATPDPNITASPTPSPDPNASPTPTGQASPTPTGNRPTDPPTGTKGTVTIVLVNADGSKWTGTGGVNIYLEGANGRGGKFGELFENVTSGGSLKSCTSRGGFPIQCGDSQVIWRGAGGTGTSPGAYTATIFDASGPTAQKASGTLGPSGGLELKITMQ